jgi:hypothetical protein
MLGGGSAHGSKRQVLGGRVRDSEKAAKLAGRLPAIIEHEIALGYQSTEISRNGAKAQ